MSKSARPLRRAKARQDQEAKSPRDHLRGRPPRLSPQDLDFLRSLTKRRPRASCQELLDTLEEERGKRIGLMTLQRALRRLGLNKRKPLRVPSTAPSTGTTKAAAAPTRYRDVHRRAPTPSSYPSDMSDQEWEVVRPLVEPQGGRGRPPRQDRRRILDAIFYIGRSGCQWRMLPKDYPPWQTVASCFYRWVRRGVLPAVYAQLRGQYRRRLGREEQPSAGILDSQSAKTTEKGGPEGMTEPRRSRGASAISSSTRSGSC